MTQRKNRRLVSYALVLVLLCWVNGCASTISIDWPVHENLPLPLEVDEVLMNWVQAYPDLDDRRDIVEDYDGNTGVDAVTYDGNMGTDIAIDGFLQMDIGHKVYAVADGSVYDLENEQPDRQTSFEPYATCNYITVQHDDGAFSKYMHLRKHSLVVEVGDDVVKGQFLGLIGSSGNSTNPHLHIETALATGTAVNHWVGPGDTDAVFGWTSQLAHLSDQASSVISLQVLDLGGKEVVQEGITNGSYVQPSVISYLTSTITLLVQVYAAKDSEFTYQIYNAAGVQVAYGGPYEFTQNAPGKAITWNVGWADLDPGEGDFQVKIYETVVGAGDQHIHTGAFTSSDGTKYPPRFLDNRGRSVILDPSDIGSDSDSCKFVDVLDVILYTSFQSLFIDDVASDDHTSSGVIVELLSYSAGTGKVTLTADVSGVDVAGVNPEGMFIYLVLEDSLGYSDTYVYHLILKGSNCVEDGSSSGYGGDTGIANSSSSSSSSTGGDDFYLYEDSFIPTGSSSSSIIDIVDECTSDDECVFGTAGACFETQGACEEGSCGYDPLEQGLACTIGGRAGECDAAGLCVETSTSDYTYTDYSDDSYSDSFSEESMCFGFICPSAPECYDSSTGVCVTSRVDPHCEYEREPEGTPCTDGICDESGECNESCMDVPAVVGFYGYTLGDCPDDDEGVPHLGECQVGCEAGYEETGGSLTVVCEDGVFTTAVGSCEELSCKVDFAVPNAQWTLGCSNGSDLAFGYLCYYTCDEGYTLTGSSHIECGFNGTLSGEPACTPIEDGASMCPAMEVEPKYGAVGGCANTLVEDGVCRIACDVGYKLSADSDEHYFCKSGALTGRQNCDVDKCTHPCTQGGSCRQPDEDHCECRMGDYGPDCALTYTCRSFDGFLEVAVGSHGWKSCDPEDHNAGFLTMHCAEEGWNTNTYKDHCYTHTENVTTSTTEGTSWSVYVKVFSVAFDTPNATSVADNGATLAQDLAINTDLPTEQLLFFQTDELTRANEGVVVLELACAHDYLLGSNLTHENVYDGVFDYLTTASFLTLPESWQALNMAQEQNSYSYYVAVTVHQCLDGTLQLVACDDILAQELVTEEQWWAVVVETDSYLWAAIALCSLMCCTVPAFTLWFRKKHQDKLAATEGYLGGNTELDEL